MTRDEKKQKRIRQLKMRVVSTLLILCLVIVAGGCALIEKNKESKKVVRVNGGVVEKTKNVADNSENTSTETKEETLWWQELEVVDHVEHYVSEGFSTNESIKRVAKERGLAKNEVYRAYHVN